MKLPAASCGVSQAELRRSQTRLRAKAVRLAIHPCSKLQGILAKANKKYTDNSRHRGIYSIVYP
jgi:hypothetical protein